MHAQHGNAWKNISAMLPGRPENSIKNHWNALFKDRAPNAEMLESSVLHRIQSSPQMEIPSILEKILREAIDSNSASLINRNLNKRRGELSQSKASAFSKLSGSVKDECSLASPSPDNKLVTPTRTPVHGDHCSLSNSSYLSLDRDIMADSFKTPSKCSVGKLKKGENKSSVHKYILRKTASLREKASIARSKSTCTSKSHNSTKNCTT